ncbi:cytochrome P450 [Mucidula mucida]|nr:cytochrome P450 [Mucidula mucida]
MTPPTLEPSSSNSSSDPAAVTLNGLQVLNHCQWTSSLNFWAGKRPTLTGTSAQARLESAIAGLSSQTAQDRAQDRAQNARFQQEIRRRLDTVETIAAEWQQLSLREPARLEHPWRDEGHLEHHEKNEGSGPLQINLYDYLSLCTLEVISRVGFGQNSDHNKHVQLSGITVIIDMFPWVLTLPIPALHEDGIAKKIILDVGDQLLSELHGVMAGGNDILSLLVNESALTKDQMLQNNGWTRNDDRNPSSDYARPGTESGRPNQAATGAENVDIGDYEALEELEYLDAVIREGLRLLPSAHDRDCIATQADVIPLSTPITLSNCQTVTSLTVKAGDRFVVPFTVVNTNPAVWGPDGPLFKPERWLVPGGVPPPNQLPRGPYGNISTLMELKVLLASMIRAFEFRDTGVKIEKRFAPVLQMFVDGEGTQVPVGLAALARWVLLPIYDPEGSP